MPVGLVGTKLGMTRVFTESGVSIPVTVVEVQSNRVARVKSEKKDGYSAVQVTAGLVTKKHVSAPLQGEFDKAGIEPGRGLWEFRLSSEEASMYSTGDSINVTHFQPGQKVDVKGTSIGKGFTGVMKRYGFGGGRATHGNSKAHRKPGSIGQNQSPSRVFPGKKMAGHLGNVKKVQQNLEIVRIDEERSLLLIKGAIPGAKNSDIIVTTAIKTKSPAN